MWMLLTQKGKISLVRDEGNPADGPGDHSQVGGREGERVGLHVCWNIWETFLPAHSRSAPVSSLYRLPALPCSPKRVIVKDNAPSLSSSARPTLLAPSCQPRTWPSAAFPPKKAVNQWTKPHGLVFVTAIEKRCCYLISQSILKLSVRALSQPRGEKHSSNS